MASQKDFVMKARGRAMNAHGVMLNGVEVRVFGGSGPYAWFGAGTADGAASVVLVGPVAMRKLATALLAALDKPKPRRGGKERK